MSNQQKKNTFYGAAAFLAMTTIIVKVIGAIIRRGVWVVFVGIAIVEVSHTYNSNQAEANPLGGS